jgi:hypothetical protein
MLAPMTLAASTGMWAGVALLALAAVLWAALLRWVRAPGWSVVGGLVAGWLIGPTILGRALPATYEHLYAGGVTQRVELDHVLREQDRFRYALSQSGATDEVYEELKLREDAEAAPLREAHEHAMERDQQALLAFTIVAVGALMLCTGLVGVPASEHKHSIAWPLNIGGWTAVLPGALAAMLLWWSDEMVATCLIAASAIMIGPWALTQIDRRAADEVEHGGARMIQDAGRISSVLAILVWLTGLAMIGGFALAMMGLPIAAMIAGWVAPPIRAYWLRRALEHSAVPIVVACAAVKVDFFEDLAFWPALLFLLLSGDGRWLGAMIGASALGGRRGVRSMRLVLGVMAAGPTQAAVAAMGAQLGVLPPDLVVAALLGAALIEVATPARRKLAERLEKTERELDELMDEE